MKKGRVILADCHLTMLGGEKKCLEEMFETVFMVADEVSLFEAAERLHPDLIVADLSLPVSGNINIVRRLRQSFPEVKLIVLSVHDEDAAVSDCFAAGARGFVLKRTAVNDLVPAVRTVLNGQVYLSPSLVHEDPPIPSGTG